MFYGLACVLSSLCLTDPGRGGARAPSKQGKAEFSARVNESPGSMQRSVSGYARELLPLPGHGL